MTICFFFSIPLQAKTTATQALERLSHLNRRTLDVIAARIVYYYSLSHEHTGSLESVRRCVGGIDGICFSKGINGLPELTFSGCLITRQ